MTTFNTLPIHAADWLVSRHPKMAGVLLIAAYAFLCWIYGEPL